MRRLMMSLIVGLALLGCARMGSAQGTWSVISPPGQVSAPSALVVDAAGNLYLADGTDVNAGRIQERDAQGHWSAVATAGIASGQVYFPYALAVDAAGSLYVADREDFYSYRIQKRDAQGNWSVIAIGNGILVSPFYFPDALAVDTAGSLYVTVVAGGIGKRDAQGNWSVTATLGQVSAPSALAADLAGNLYAAERVFWLPLFGRYGADRIQERDARGRWSEIATEDQVLRPNGLAVDTHGNLYVADESDFGQVQKRDAQGAVDMAGNLYVADTGNNRVLKYTPQQ
jgi:sugar lactone lactonase YvrE